MYSVSVQRIVPHDLTPPLKDLKKWAKAVLKLKTKTAELSIRIVDKDEMTHLNSHYRHKNYATNVLSFPFDMPDEIDNEIPLLGDIVICAEVVNEEAAARDISSAAHWAHMIVHGTLHLLGYDHETAYDAAIMEPLEIDILAKLGFTNPYQEPKVNYNE